MTKAVIVNIIIAYVMFILFVYFVSDKMIFVPPRATYKDSTNLLKLTASDGVTIYAHYLPNKNAKYTLLMSHGNAEDLGTVMSQAQEMHDNGFSVFIYDYHGYGFSGGKPSENNAYTAIDAAYEYLTKTLNTPPDDIVLYGFSLGAAVALDLAVRKPAAALILQGGFVSAFRVITHIQLLPFDKFNSIEKIPKLTIPLLVIHGTKDRVIPYSHGRKLYEKAKVPKKFLRVENAGHMDVSHVGGQKYWQTIKDFLK